MTFWQWIQRVLAPKVKTWIPVPMPRPKPPAPSDEHGGALQVMQCMNDVRARNGLVPFLADSRLDASAQAHSSLMSSMNVFDHQCPGEPQFDQRIAAQGYVFSYASENIAAGQQSAQEVVDDWMNETYPNDGHRRAILGPALNAGCGVSYAANTQWGWYWTADFASPRA